MRTLRLSLIGTVTLALVGGLGSVVMAQDATDQAVEPDSILFVGNSFTENLGGVENHVSALAGSENPPREIVAAARTMGGATLKTHHQESDPNGVFGAVAAINAGDHDVVVLQDDIPEYLEHALSPFLEEARWFDQLVRDAGGETVFFMTWPYERLDWVSLDEIVGAHRQVEAELGAKVAPVGVAMANALAERPDLAMLGPDAEHESAAGHYLAAAVIYATVFDRTPEGLPFHHMISAEDAAFLQRVAWQTVEAWRQGVPSGSAVAAPDEAVAERPDLPVLVTGTESCGPRTSGETIEVNGIESHRDLVGECRGAMSDPRVNGVYTNTFSSQCLAPSSSYPGEMCLFWGSHVLEGPEGGWDCAYQGTDDPTGRNWGLLQGTCPGTGGFAGLTYVFYHVFGGANDFGDGTSYHGLIYEGPPLGEPWPLPSE